VEIQYNKKKKDMKSDPLVDSISASRDFIQKNNRQIITFLTIVVLVAGAYFLYSSLQKQRSARAQEAFGKAMVSFSGQDAQKTAELLSAVIDNYKGTAQAAYSAYLLGSELLKRNQTEQAIDKLSIAASSGRKAGFVGAAALEGISVAYEAQGNPSEALRYLDKAIAEKSLGYRVPQLKWKKALLLKSSQSFSEATALCDDLLTDTLAVDLHQKVKNLKTELNILAQ